MKRATQAFILVAALGVGLAAQTTPPSTNTGGATAPTAVNPAPADSSLRILTPVANQKHTANVVNVRWQLTNEALSAGVPNYEVQLDGADPINTSTTEQSFSGLAPGVHTVVIRLVDANGTPIAGGSSQVQFVVTPPDQAAPGSPRPQSKLEFPKAELVNAAYVQTRQPEQGPTEEDAPLPSSASSLPLLSIVGFGALIGGVVSARKTHRR
jgi:hypothetical protein